MATKRRRRRRTRRTVAANPRRRRHVRRRRHSTIVARSRRRYAPNPRHRRRHHRRRSNPSAMKIGEIAKDMIYGAGGAIATRVVFGVVSGFIPVGLASSRLAQPIAKAAIASTIVRWGGTKFLGARQGSIMQLGGLIDAGIDLTNAFLGDVTGQLTTIIRAPVTSMAGALTPGATAGTVAPANVLADVEDVPIYSSAFGALGDVEDIPVGSFGYGM